MGREIRFSDYVEFMTERYDIFIYNPVYFDGIGFCLIDDNDKPIKYIQLIDSILTIYYLDGSEQVIDIPIMSITVDERRLTKRADCGISGKLFKYDKKDAIYYNLDMTKALDYDVIKRKRSM